MLPLVKVGLPPSEQLMPSLERVLYSGQIAEGEQVYEFEERFSKHFGLSHVLAMSSGTAALHAALTLSGVSPGDEVISTPMTAEPTNTSILYCGAKVVWADVDPVSGNIDPNSILEKITSKTKAIIVVHYAGYPVRLAEIREIADRHGISLIEDCAHALGAKYDGNSVGLIGDFSIFSFQAIKHMPMVDGGVLICKEERHMRPAKKFRWFGMLKGVPRTEVDITSIGYKYNMNNVVATIGLSQLQVIDARINAFKENGKYFDHELAKIPGLDFAKCDEKGESSYWLYTMLSDTSDEIEKSLAGAGIHASKLHRPNNFHSIFSQSETSLPGLEKFYQRLLHIPCGWWVSAEDRNHIVNALRKG
ncbi:DegT/DnrJ/EryC1/StrS family aminotransferase [Comamonas suwonensis]|uniref:DegT/DnrJ/EryC1/StrS family aminotransferase n=1 Tax=Comamonas suwonensis TaxID=2606214 RepID=UPI00145C5DDF|nr:DegT/DnrJ/EryC1/StrS family aminotransferase [Comamonas suwonensis]MBI1624172.1 DegT/DnrJ/EryC1/StrS family aminotransferase [Comamonas suwonensis]